MGNGEAATDLNFMQEVRENLGGFSPFLTLSYQRCIDCLHFQASPDKANSHAAASSAIRTSLNPPATKKGKCHRTTTRKAVLVGHFQHVNVSNLNLQVYFFICFDMHI